MVLNETFNILDPNSFPIYFAILILSVLIFLASCGGILFCLFLSYKEWCCLIHQYCSNIVYMRFPDTDYEAVRKLSLDLLDSNIKVAHSENSDEENEISKPNRYNPDNLSSRVTTIRIITGEMFDDVKVIEIEPNGFVENLEKLEKEIRSVGPDRELGRLSFTLDYFLQKQELHIRNLRGEGLRKKDSQVILNPYITFNIWPDNLWPIKTKVIQRTNTPTWNETLIIEQFEFKNLANKALHFKIQSWKQLRQNDIIGHIILPLRIIQNVTEDKSYSEHFIKNLQPELQINRGSIRLMLRFHQEEEINELIISVLNAKLIYPPGTTSDQCEVFVKISVFHPDVNDQHKFTTMNRGSFQPTWNEHLTFKMPNKKYFKLSIMISVREEGFSKEGKLFAYTELGQQHSESNNFHLFSALKYPNKTIAQWHQLLSNIL